MRNENTLQYNCKNTFCSVVVFEVCARTMLKIFLWLSFAAETYTQINFFDKCVQSRPTKGDECRKISPFKFAIVIDRSIYRGRQTSGDGSDDNYDKFYETFLKAFRQRTNFPTGQVLSTVMVTDTQAAKHIRTPKHYGPNPISDNDLVPPYDSSHSGGRTYLDVALEDVSIIKNFQPVGGKMIVLGNIENQIFLQVHGTEVI